MKQERARNIMLFFTDEQRRDTLGCYGNQVCRTPNIDAIAREGVLFEEAYTPTAVCTPARASLLSGVYPQKHLLVTNPKKTWGAPVTLNEKFPPFSHYLRQAGYNIASIGKWHIGKQSPAEFGFEGHFYPGWDETRDHPDYLQYLKDHNLPDFTVRDEIGGMLPNGKPGTTVAGVYNGPVEGTFTYYLAERTLEKLRAYARDYRQNGRPFFLSFHIFGPHLPYYLPEKYARMYDPADVVLPGAFDETFAHKPHIHKLYSHLWAADSLTREQWRQIIAMYWGYVTMIDDQIGRVLAALRECGLEEETAVFFATDHGSFEGNHRLNDKGPAAYDDIYRIPYLAKLPGGLRNKRAENFVTLMDLTATFIDLAGVPVPSHLDGRSLLPLLNGTSAEPWPDEVFLEFHGHQVPYAQRVVRTRDYKLIANLSDLHELYDLRRDPDELVNRIDDPEYDGVKKDLYARLCRHLRRIEDDTALSWIEKMYA
ncbi:MAG: sulfatase-like hydrolase/transferase [Bacteroidota bacterium]